MVVSILVKLDWKDDLVKHIEIELGVDAQKRNFKPLHASYGISLVF
jgi:hypothetical protein